MNAQGRADTGRAIVVLLVVAVLVQLPGLFWGAPGGKSINNSLRILAGDVPYRDFWTMYAPGSFYLGALLFRIFGNHIWVAGIASIALVSLSAVIVFHIARRLGASGRTAFLAGLLLVGVESGTHRALGTYETVLVPLLLAFHRVVAYAQGDGRRTLFEAGLLLGVAAWFKHDVAMYVWVGTAVGLSAAWWWADRSVHWVAPTGVVSRLAAGAAIGIAPMAGYIIWYAAADAWRDLLVFPATDFRVVRGEGYPRLLPNVRAIARWLNDPANVQRGAQMGGALVNWTLGLAPELVFAGGVLALVRAGRRLAGWVVALAAVALASMPFFWSAAHVQQNTHLVSMWLCSMVVVGVLAPALHLSRLSRRTVLAFVTVYAAAELYPAAANVLETAYFWPTRRALTLPMTTGVFIPQRNHQVYEPIVGFVRAAVPEGEAIYVGLVRHDSIVISNQTFYYLAERPIASRYNELHPGIADRDEVQREIIDDLERLGVRCAVLWEFGWPKTQMDDILATRQRTLPDVGATRLDAYFRDRFQELFRRGEFIVMWRKDAAPPSIEARALVERVATATR